MKKEVMKKWVKALRSGEYEQGKQRLVNSKDKFCCLGVLCNIAPDKTGEWIDGGYEWEFVSSNNGDLIGEAFQLPPSVMEWSGIKDPVGSYSEFGCLAGLNDSGKSFEYIADIIEENWEDL